MCCDQGEIVEEGQGWDSNTDNNVVWGDIDIDDAIQYLLLGTSSNNSSVEEVLSPNHFSSPVDDDQLRSCRSRGDLPFTSPPPPPPDLLLPSLPAPPPVAPCSSSNFVDQELAGFDHHYRAPDQKRSKRIRYSYVNNTKDEEEIQSIEESTNSLGLKLNKSPSLIDMVERRLLKGKSPCSNSSRSNSNSPDHNTKKKPSAIDYGSLPMSEKLKASNFPAVSLKIGNWEVNSKNEGDLVAKCYYAKKKLVWEILDGSLKSKIEIQWNDIIGIRATMPENEGGTLEIELSKAPSFFKETNPQPRKHTLWQPTEDFTGGAAPTYRIHYVKFPSGALDKHYEKLLQCHPNLSSISQKPFPTEPSPYFGRYDSPSDFVLHGYGSQLHHFLTTPNWISPTRPNLPNLPWSGLDQYPSTSAVNNTMMMMQNGTPPVIFPNQVLPYEGLNRMVPNANMGSLGYIENHLLGDNQSICWGENVFTQNHMRTLQHPLVLHDQLQMANMRPAGVMMQQVIAVPDGDDHSLMGLHGQQDYGDIAPTVVPMNTVPLNNWEIAQDLRIPQASIMSSPYEH